MDAAITHLEDRVATSISSRKESDTMIFHPNYCSRIKTIDNFAHVKKQGIFLRNFWPPPFSFKEILDKVIQRTLFQPGNEWQAMTCNYSEVC